MAKGAYSTKLPNARIDCSISDESPDPSKVLVLSLSVPVLYAKKTAKIDRRDAYKSVISILMFFYNLSFSLIVSLKKLEYLLKKN